MAKAVTLKNNNNEEVYPVTDLSLVNGNIPTGRIADNAITTPKIADSAVTSAKIDWTTLWSGELKNYNTGTENAVTLSESISNFKYIDFIIRLTNWVDQDSNVVFRHYVGLMNYSVGACNVSVFYAFGGNTANVRCGTLRFDETTLFWDNNRSLSINWSGSTSTIVTDLSDGAAISLLRVVGYR